jgi:DNA-directed RNA polymerase specialized sigma subunit
MKFYIIIIFLITNVYSFIYSNNLTIQQWISIRSLIKNPGLTTKMRETINSVIYSRYKTWATHKAYKFKYFHRFNCRNVNVNDLILCSLSGLSKAIINYNGCSSFYKYADIYILGELYKGLTDLQPMNNISKKIRRSKTNIFKANSNNVYKKRLNTLFLGFDEYWQFEKRQDNNIGINYFDKYNESWEKINKLDDFKQLVFKYKYNYYFDKIRSNLEISKLLGCSEEYVRKTLKKSIKNIVNKNINGNIIIIE